MQQSLNRRELEIAALVAEGLSNKRIAARLVIGERTAGTHIANIMNELGVNARAQVVAWATAQGVPAPRLGAEQQSNPEPGQLAPAAYGVVASARRLPDRLVRLAAVTRNLRHPGTDDYISWEQYEENLQRLNENAQANGAERRESPPREGPALLQGLAVCGRCGERMTMRYHASHGQLVPEYLCQR